MNDKIVSFKTKEEWEGYFNRLIYNLDYIIINPIGTIESELNFIFNQLIKNGQGLDNFWTALLDTFSTIPAKNEYINTIYSTICFIDKNLPMLYRKSIRQIILKKKFAGLKINENQPFDLNDLLVKSLVSKVYTPDNNLYSIIMNAINKRKPYYYYLLTKYYFNDGQRKRAVNLLRSFIQKEESSFNKDAYFNCLYAWDENVPENMGWIEIILDIAAEVEFHNSRLLQWQYVIYASFIKDKAKGYIGNEDLSDSDLALILLCAYFTNDINYYNRFLYQLSEFERRFPKVAKISEKIFPLNEIMYKGDLDISTNEDEVRDVYNEFKNYSLN